MANVGDAIMQSSAKEMPRSQFIWCGLSGADATKIGRRTSILAKQARQVRWRAA